MPLQTRPRFEKARDGQDPCVLPNGGVYRLDGARVLLRVWVSTCGKEGGDDSATVYIHRVESGHRGNGRRGRILQCYHFAMGIADDGFHGPTDDLGTEKPLYWLKKGRSPAWQLPRRTPENTGIPRSGAEALALLNSVRRDRNLPEVVEDANVQK